MRPSRRRNLVAVSAALVVAAVSASPALADGYCGHDLYETSACPVPTSQPITGTYEADGTSNWFVFFARRDTRLTLSVADDENPACASITFAGCSDVAAALWGSSGILASTPLAQPQEGPGARIGVRTAALGQDLPRADHGRAFQ